MPVAPALPDRVVLQRGALKVARRGRRRAGVAADRVAALEKGGLEIFFIFREIECFFHVKKTCQSGAGAVVVLAPEAPGVQPGKK